MKLRDKLTHFKRRHGIVTETPCTEAETQEIKRCIATNQAIPSVFYLKQTADGARFFRLDEPGDSLTEEETVELMLFVQGLKLNSIRRIAIVIAIFAFLGVLVSFLYLSGILSALS